MTTAIPEVRARGTQEVLDFMDEYEPGLRERVEHRVPAEVLRMVRDTPSSGYLPMLMTQHVVRAIIDEIGEAPTVTLYRHFVAKRFIKTPLIRRFVEAWLRLSGASPASLLKFSVKGWATTYRNVGTLELEDSDDRSATLVLRDVPVALFEMPVFVLVFKGVFEGLIAVSGAEGSAIPDNDRPTRSIRFRLDWQTQRG